MKENLIIAAIIITTVLFIGFFMYITREFNNIVTPIAVYEVEPGVKCATMVTADGVAIDCWKI